MSLRVVIVDDHDGFRRSARRLLEEAGFVVVAEAADVASAVATVRDADPDIVLLDVVLPGGSGLDVADALAGTRAAVVLVSSRDAGDYGPRLALTKAAGFVRKDRLSAAVIMGLVSP